MVLQIDFANKLLVGCQSLWLRWKGYGKLSLQLVDEYLVEKQRRNHLGAWEKDIAQEDSRKQDRQTLSRTNVYHHCIQRGRKYHDRDRHVQ